MLIENGARFAEVDIRPGTATIFPQGAIHFEMNPSCEPAMFVAAFDNEDPGVGQVAQRCKSLLLIHYYDFFSYFACLQTSVFPLTLLVQLSMASVSRRFSDSNP